MDVHSAHIFLAKVNTTSQVAYDARWDQPGHRECESGFPAPGWSSEQYKLPFGDSQIDRTQN
jgi:hypothetical protein